MCNYISLSHVKDHKDQTTPLPYGALLSSCCLGKGGGWLESLYFVRTDVGIELFSRYLEPSKDQNLNINVCKKVRRLLLTSQSTLWCPFYLSILTKSSTLGRVQSRKKNKVFKMVNTFFFVFTYFPCWINSLKSWVSLPVGGMLLLTALLISGSLAAPSDGHLETVPDVRHAVRLWIKITFLSVWKCFSPVKIPQ